MSLIEKHVETIIFDGPQGSGKTTAVNFLSSTYGFIQLRGIPDAQNLAKNSLVENWSYTNQLLKQKLQDAKPYIIDRCIWSFITYESNKRGFERLLFRLGNESFRDSVKNANYKLVLLDSEPDLCFERKKGKSSPYAWKSIDEVRKEVMCYRRLQSRLRGAGFNVICLQNNSSLEYFKNNLHNLLMGGEENDSFKEENN